MSPYVEEDPCKQDEIESIADELIDTLEGPSEDFKKELLGFLKSYGQKVLQTYRKFQLEKKTTLTPVEKHLERLTLSQMVEFVNKCKVRHFLNIYFLKVLARIAAFLSS